MARGTLLSDEPASAHDEIMFATYDALQKYGYAGLSIQRIADESEHSKSTFYHHFDGKEDLLLSFVDFILESFSRTFEFESAGDPEADLRIYLQLVIGQYPDKERPGIDELLDTYMSLRSQAVYDEQYRERFTEMSEGHVEMLTEIIEEGIETGVFRDVDPETEARFLLTVADGAILEKTTRTDDPMPMLHDKLMTYIDDNILAEDE